MSAAAKNLTSEENCEEEYENGLSVVMQAYRGLRSYGLMYSATCLQDPDSENYCYANAVTNLTTPSDGYLYFLPYDLDMPGSATPSCNSCNQETMSIFHELGLHRRPFFFTWLKKERAQVSQPVLFLWPQRCFFFRTHS